MVHIMKNTIKLALLLIVSSQSAFAGEGEREYFPKEQKPVEVTQISKDDCKKDCCPSEKNEKACVEKSKCEKS
jgi:hypothetical protein